MAFNKNNDSSSIINRRKDRVYICMLTAADSLVDSILENELIGEMSYDCQIALRAHLKFKVMNLKISQHGCFSLVIICFSRAYKYCVLLGKNDRGRSKSVKDICKGVIL